MARRVPESRAENARTAGALLYRFGHAHRTPLHPLDLNERDHFEDIGLPGRYPFTRGVQSTMYRARLWTMRMFAGLGSAEDTNNRFHYLISHGETGLSTAFDFPTLMGYDTDSPLARGECGKCGVAIDTIEDMRRLFANINLEEVTTSMTINPPASIIWAMYLANAENEGYDRRKLGAPSKTTASRNSLPRRP